MAVVLEESFAEEMVSEYRGDNSPSSSPQQSHEEANSSFGADQRRALSALVLDEPSDVDSFTTYHQEISLPGTLDVAELSVSRPCSSTSQSPLRHRGKSHMTQSERSPSRNTMAETPDRNGEPNGRGRKTETGTQTEAEDDDWLPSAHINNFSEHDRPFTALGRDKWGRKQSKWHDIHQEHLADEYERERGSVWHVELDAPKRLQARNNKRKGLNRCQLLRHDFKLWWRRWRKGRRDPIPIWTASIKGIEGQFGSGVGSFFVFIRWVFFLEVIFALVTFSFIAGPAAGFSTDYNLTDDFEVVNLVDGKGQVGETWMFFGGYAENYGGSYLMDLAYLLVPIVLFLGCLATMMLKIMNDFGKLNHNGSFVTLDKRIPYSKIILGSWDHTINSPTSVTELQRGISVGIKELVADAKAKDSKVDKTTKQRAVIYANRALAWLLWALMCAGSFTGLWYLVEDEDPNETGFIETYKVAIVFTLSNAGLPALIRALFFLDHVKHPARKIQLICTRIFLLRILNLYAFLYGLYKKTDLSGEQLPVWTEGTIVPQENCAGTVIGQNFYKLLIIDTLFTIPTQITYTLCMYFWCKRQRFEVDLTDGLLQMVYRQALEWGGLFFCPIIPLFGIFYNVVYFYVNKALVLRFNLPPAQQWRQGRNNSFFIITLTGTLILVLVPLCLSLQWYKPNCGPYGDPKYTNVFDAFQVWVEEKSPEKFQEFYEVITNGLIVLTFIFCLKTSLFPIPRPRFNLCCAPNLTVMGVFVSRVQLKWSRALQRETLQELMTLRDDRRYLWEKQSENIDSTTTLGGQTKRGKSKQSEWGDWVDSRV